MDLKRIELITQHDQAVINKTLVSYDSDNLPWCSEIWNKKKYKMRRIIAT
jgi:hypothetical protein